MLKVQLLSVPAARVTKLVLHSPFLLPSSVPAESSLPWGQAAQTMEFWAASGVRMSSSSSSTLRWAGGGYSRKKTKAFHYAQRNIRQWGQGIRSNLLEQGMPRQKEGTLIKKKNKHSLVWKYLLLLPLWAAKYLGIAYLSNCCNGALGRNWICCCGGGWESSKVEMS